jgi:hypothetical protein
MSKLDYICAWHILPGFSDAGHEGEGLLKSGKIGDTVVWPEPWSPEKKYIKQDSKAWKAASHGCCPECAWKIKKLNRLNHE